MDEPRAAASYVRHGRRVAGLDGWSILACWLRLVLRLEQSDPALGNRIDGLGTAISEADADNPTMRYVAP